MILGSVIFFSELLLGTQKMSSSNSKPEDLPAWMQSAPKNEATQKSSLGKYFAYGFGGLVIFGSWVGFQYILKPINKGLGKGITLPYIPATDAQVENILKALAWRHPSLPPIPARQISDPLPNFIDIGSGDGRICRSVAQNGYQSTGIEINRPLVWLSKYRTLTSKIPSSICNFKTADVWKYDLSKYQNVCIFGVEEMMPRLGEKFRQELKPGSKIVVCRFPLPGDWQPIYVNGAGIDTVWLYEIPLENQISDQPVPDEVE